MGISNEPLASMSQTPCHQCLIFTQDHLCRIREGMVVSYNEDNNCYMVYPSSESDGL